MKTFPDVIQEMESSGGFPYVIHDMECSCGFEWVLAYPLNYEADLAECDGCKKMIEIPPIPLSEYDS